MSTDFNGHGMDISLRDYVDVFHRRRAIIIQTCVFVIAVGFIINLVTKPRYRSSTRIVLEGKSSTPTTQDADNPLAGLFLQDQGHSIATQVGMIQGEEVLSETAADVLAERKKNNDLAPMNIVDTNVTTVTGTDIVDITVESENQKDAYEFAKQLPKSYDDFTRNNQAVEIKNAHKVAVDQQTDAIAKLQKTRKELAQLRDKSGIYDILDDRKMKGEMITDSLSALGGAEVSVDQAQAQLDILIKQRAKLEAKSESPTETTNPDIRDIQNQIDNLNTQKASLEVLLTEDSPKVQAITVQIADLQKRLAAAPPMVVTKTIRPNDEIAEYDRKIADTKVELAGAQAAQTAALGRQGEVQKAQMGSDNDIEEKQEDLEEKVERYKTKELALVKTQEDLELREAALRPVVTLVTPSHHALKVSPKRAQNLMFAGILGLVLGICFALLQEYLDDRVNSPEHVKALISAPTLGFIPLVKQEAELIISANTASALMESYRALRSNVGFATVDSDTSAILVTSTRPGEGKSTTAVNLAASMALDDKKVILVDLDLRRPTVHTKLHLDPECGVTNVLMGHKTLEEALQPTEIPGLQVLTSGPMPPNPAELMNSQAMRRLLDELKHSADVVIIDSPPLLATADSQVLSALVDGVVYVIQFGVVRKPELRHAYSLLHQANINMLGVVFNKIDVSTNREYGYGVYEHYNHYTANNETDTSPISSSAFKRMIAQIDPAKTGDDLPAKPGDGSAQNGGRPKPRNEKRP